MLLSEIGSRSVIERRSICSRRLGGRDSALAILTDRSRSPMLLAGGRPKHGRAPEASPARAAGGITEDRSPRTLRGAGARFSSGRLSIGGVLRPPYRQPISFLSFIISIQFVHTLFINKFYYIIEIRKGGIIYVKFRSSRLT